MNAMVDLDNGVRTRQPPLTVGMWLEYSPAVEQRGQGISRLTAWLVRSLAARPEIRVVLATARWSEEDIRKLLLEHQVPMDRVEIITSRRRIPIALRVRAWLRDRARRERRRKRSRLRRFLRRTLYNRAIRGIMH